MLLSEGERNRKRERFISLLSLNIQRGHPVGDTLLLPPPSSECGLQQPLPDTRLKAPLEPSVAQRDTWTVDLSSQSLSQFSFLSLCQALEEEEAAPPGFALLPVSSCVHHPILPPPGRALPDNTAPDGTGSSLPSGFIHVFGMKSNGTEASFLLSSSCPGGGMAIPEKRYVAAEKVHIRPHLGYCKDSDIRHLIDT